MLAELREARHVRDLMTAKNTKVLKLIAEARKDTERLEWLEEKCCNSCAPKWSCHSDIGTSLREDIDAAKEKT